MAPSNFFDKSAIAQAPRSLVRVVRVYFHNFFRAADVEDHPLTVPIEC
jgi:hypothetical protein